MRGGKLLGQGTYGCVFSPGFQCASRGSSKDHTLQRNKKIVSKVQINDNTSQNEIHIGKQIQKIPNAKQYFQVLEQACPVKINQLQDNDIKKCELDTIKHSKLVMLSLPFIEGTHPIAWLRTKNDPVKRLKKIMQHLATGLVKLQEIGIIHHDIKNDNILVKPSGHAVFLDFGMSLDINDPKYLNQLFYSPDYELWCPEIHLMNEPQITSAHIEEIVFYTLQPLSLILEKPFLEKYRELLTKSLKQWKKLDDDAWKNSKKKQPRNHLHTITRQKMSGLWNTWDVYSLSMLLLVSIAILKGEGHIQENEEMHNLIQIGLKGIHPINRVNAKEWLALLE